jgi:hypothetical protein
LLYYNTNEGVGDDYFGIGLNDITQTVEAL